MGGEQAEAAQAESEVAPVTILRTVSPFFGYSVGVVS